MWRQVDVDYRKPSCGQKNTASQLSQLAQFTIGMLIAVVWIQSATAHFGNSYFFLSSIYKYRLVGADLGRYLAIVLPSLQFVLAICLLSRMFVGGALLGSALLLTCFTGIQISAFVRELKIDCGCFGPVNSSPIGQGSIATVIVLTGLAYVALACFIVQCWSSNPWKLLANPADLSDDP